LLASHEFFHAVQAAYDVGQGSVLGEGTAVWASEQFDPSLDDLEGFGFAYLDETSRALNADGGGPVDSFTYGTALWFDHIATLHGDDIVRAIYEAVDDAGGASAGADWFVLLDDVLAGAAQAPSSFEEDFLSFATSKLGVVEPDSVSLPYAVSSFFMFTASWQTLSFNPAGRAQVRIALVGEGIDVDGIHLVISSDGGDTHELVEPAAATGDVPVAFDVTRANAQQFFRVQLINTRREGNGSRPRLCIGDDDEVEACIAEELAPPAEGEGEGEGEDPPPPSCACASIANGPLAFALALLLARRRRRSQ
jgi:hypothetical protein